jgi:hypothetical protein
LKGWLCDVCSARFTAPPCSGPSQHSSFPFQFRRRQITIKQVKVFLKLADGFPNDDTMATLTFHLNGRPAVGFANAGTPVAGLPFAQPQVTPFAAGAQLTVAVQESELPKTVPTDADWWQIVTIAGVDHVRLRPDAVFFRGMAGRRGTPRASASSASAPTRSSSRSDACHVRVHSSGRHLATG